MLSLRVRRHDMPMYEYKCRVCDYCFEQIQKFSDAPVQVCPQCGKQVERLLSAPSFQFKGSGWYITDYARKNSPSPSPAKTEDSGGEKKDFSHQTTATPKPETA